MKTTLFLNAIFSALKKATDSFNKNKRCHITLKGLSSVCAKLEAASSKNNEILEINVLQKFTSHALLQVFLEEAVPNVHQKMFFDT